MAHIPIPELVSHSQKVCRFYKRALRNIYSWHPQMVERRYECVLLRHRFDQNKDIKDLRLAKKLLIDGEMELRNELHPQQLCFPDSPQGPAFDRDFPVPDWIVDYWHPMEKAMYPKYFALREKRKKEYVEFYQKNYLSTAKNEPPSH